MVDCDSYFVTTYKRNELHGEEKTEKRERKKRKKQNEEIKRKEK